MMNDVPEYKLLSPTDQKYIDDILDLDEATSGGIIIRSVTTIHSNKLYEAIKACAIECGFSLRQQGNHLVLMCPPYTEHDIVISF